MYPLYNFRFRGQEEKKHHNKTINLRCSARCFLFGQGDNIVTSVSLQNANHFSSNHLFPMTVFIGS